jgi:LacI family transcriptional regulator
MDEIGYVRHGSAAQLRAGRSRTVGLLVLDIGNPFFTDLARGVEDVAADHDLTVLLCSADASPERQDRHLQFFEEQRVDGTLVTPVDGDRRRLDQLRGRGTPVVLVDDAGGPADCSVAVDDVTGGALAGEHLLELGRRRIVYVTGPDTIRQCAERERGLRRAVAAAGLDPDRVIHRVQVPSLTGEAGHQATDRVLADDRTDSVFCANDVVALGVLRGLLEAGRRVPDDIALVGYDDIEFAGTAAVPLTSVRQPAREIGRTAASLLLEEIAAPGHHHRQVLFTPELVARPSTTGGRTAVR